MRTNPLIISLLIIIAGVISIELGVSVAILEIIAGVVAKNVIGVIDFPWIDFLANFGLLGIMFFAGFETDVPLLKKHLKKSILIGLASYLGPFILVFGLSALMFSFTINTSFLVAIGLSTTSLALVYTVLREMKILEGESGQIILTSAMVVDILSMLSLTVLFEGINIFSLVILLLVIPSLYFLPKIGKWIFSRYKGDMIEFKTRFILLVLLGLVVISDTVKVHVAVLAFITGIVFSELMEEHKILEKKLRGIVFGFMAPLFFFKAGLSMDIFNLNLDAIKIIILLGFAAYIGKYLSTYVAMRSFFKGVIPKLSGLIFNFRLSFGIVVASFGLSAGMVSQNVYTAMLTIIILTSIISAVIMKIVPYEV